MPKTKPLPYTSTCPAPTNTHLRVNVCACVIHLQLSRVCLSGVNSFHASSRKGLFFYKKENDTFTDSQTHCARDKLQTPKLQKFSRVSCGVSLLCCSLKNLHNFMKYNNIEEKGRFSFSLSDCHTYKARLCNF